MGKTVARETAKIKVMDSAVGIAAGLFAFSKKAGNEELMSISNVSHSDLRIMRENDFKERLETLKETAVRNSDALNNFGITQQKIDRYISKLADYKSKTESRSSSTVEKTGASKSLNAIFIEADNTLLMIDKIMEGIKDDYPDFYLEYKAARVIRETGIKHRKEKVTQSQSKQQ